MTSTKGRKGTITIVKFESLLCAISLAAIFNILYGCFVATFTSSEASRGFPEQADKTIAETDSVRNN